MNSQPTGIALDRGPAECPWAENSIYFPAAACRDLWTTIPSPSCLCLGSSALRVGQNVRFLTFSLNSKMIAYGHRAAFVPIDPHWPLARISEIIQCSGVSAIIQTEEGLPTTHEVSAVVWLTIKELLDLSNDIAGGFHCSSDDSLEVESPIPPPLPWCYVMFTSGSTGRPLGVLGTEEGILNRCRWMQHQGLISQPLQSAGHNESAGTEVQGRPCIAIKTPVSFVDSVWEMFAPLLLPCSAVILQPKLSLEPARFWRALARNRVTHLSSVPSLLRLALSDLEAYQRSQISAGTTVPSPSSSLQDAASPLCLKVVISSGEPLPWDLSDSLLHALPDGCRLINLYGEHEAGALSGVSIQVTSI